jgi:hypothetical protein
VDTLVHAEQFLGLHGEGSITAPAAVAIALTAVQTENAANIQRPLWVQTGKGSEQAHVYRYAPISGHRSTRTGFRLWAQAV